ncbi:MAG: UvrD-helicase domain-containing protein [Prevotella sp.]|nr:UvrD-helicase domain-containing protein [Prevotella sp.]
MNEDFATTPNPSFPKEGSPDVSIFPKEGSPVVNISPKEGSPDMNISPKEGNPDVKGFLPDESQQQVIEAEGGYHLVLAPPGCGKTQILTERIRRAHRRDGVAYEDMLCLTFTNRAARGMQERIRENIDDDGVSKVYVGNIHRFCSKFLFEQSVIPAETSIIDDEDAISIVARYLDEDEVQVMDSPQRRREYFDIIHFSHFMQQLQSEQPKELRLHPESCNSEDVAAMKKICEVQKMAFDAKSMLDIYDHTDFYLTASRMDGYDLGSQVTIDRLLRKMTIARQYEHYKRENSLVDFEDLLILAYDCLRSQGDQEGVQDDAPVFHRYRWIQVDEVQDLNPLQLAIVDLITAHDGTVAEHSISVIQPPSSITQVPSSVTQLPSSVIQKPTPFTVMYLGDEQQAIFSFMGARLSTLDALRRRCGEQVHHLSTNHRSPEYLLEVFNQYAQHVLGIDNALLPKASPLPNGKSEEGALRILRSNTLETEYYDVAHVARLLTENSADETTAIIVNSNADADMVSEELAKMQQPHFKVSGEDLFSTKEVKLLLAHLNVLANEHNFIAWARLLRGLNVTASNAFARNFVQSLRQRAMLPSDFLCYDGSTYLEQFVSAYEQGDIVVFDTETTGLDVVEDEIVQIAAVRVRQGRVVEGSAFNVFLQTIREIPEMLGDTPNPILEELKHHELLPPAEGLQRFLDYVGRSVLLGHNALFDWQMLHSNLQRVLPEGTSALRADIFDSLKLIRLLKPDLKQYKLKYLLAVLHLEGENSHLADADVAATCSLMSYCYAKAQEAVPRQREFMSQRRVQERVAALRKNYQATYLEALRRLHDWPAAQPMVGELQLFHDELVGKGVVRPVEKLRYISRYMEEDLVDTATEHTLAQQLAAHIVEINTLKEADLCNSRSLDDRVFVTTVHKAKGLEFDNVIVFDAVEDRYPSYFNRNNPTGIAEDARKFYVALTRARKRLYVSQCLSRLDWHGQPRERKLTRFMNPIQRFFS